MVNYEPVNYELIRTRRKTIAIHIKDDASVVVRAPQRASKRAIETFVSKNIGWIERKVEERKRYNLAYPEPTAREVEEKVKRASEIIPPIVEMYAAAMNLYPADIKISKARKRYGSCSGKNSLNFSYMLVDYPMEAIEYVVVHELAHIVHKNHGPKFYSLLEKYLPDYTERRSLLKNCPRR